MTEERFTPDEMEVLLHAWALSVRGGAVIPAEGDKLLACHNLAERGWLARRWHGDTMAFEWTPRAEARSTSTG